MAPSSQVSDLRSRNISSVDTSQQREGDATECTSTKNAGRGKTTGLSIAKKKRKSATGKLHVIIPPDKKVAVGPGASDFVTEISVVVQKNAPLNVPNWRKVPQIAKDKIILKVLDTFDIDNTEHNRQTILEEANRLYRSHRKRLHDHYQRYETNDEALEHKPSDVSEEDWESLVNYFSSAEFKDISERNKRNRAKQAINHRCGRKSFQAVSYDARNPETGKEPNFHDLWQMTHMNNNGEWVDEASREVNRKVEEISVEMLQDIDDGTDKDPIINAAFVSVVGERSGYCRGLGAGVRPTKGKYMTGLREQLEEERGKRESLDIKLKEVESQLEQERKKREELETRFEEGQRQLQERMEAMFLRMQDSSVGQFASAMNMPPRLDHTLGTSTNMATDKT